MFSNILFRYHKWSKAEMGLESQNQFNDPRDDIKPVYSRDPMGDFLHFLLHKTNKKQTNIVFSHNGGRYDNILMAGKAYKLPQIQIKPVAQGNKIFNLVVKRGSLNIFDLYYVLGKRSRVKVTRTEFRDSINLIPIPLAKMVKTWGLKEPDLSNPDEEGKMKPLDEKGFGCLKK
jgi:hypothetical protein